MTLCLIREVNRRRSCLFTVYYRQCSDKSQSSGKIPSKLTKEAVRENVRGYMFTRFFDLVKNYDKVLEKNFPSAMHVYRIFFEGVKDFYKDMKQYLKITKIAKNSSDGPMALTRKELELYLRMPRDMIKIAPTLFLTSLPLVGYAVFPLAYMYPRIFLTSHFWSIQQRAEFNEYYLKQRLQNNIKVFRCLQAKLKSIKDDPHYSKWKHILGLLGSGLHPTTGEIIMVRDIFVKPPYNLDSLTQKHLKHLCHMHGLGAGIFKSLKLIEHAYLIHNMDLAIKREGGVHNMHPDALKHACYLRGLNPVNLSNELMIEWLRDWIKVSLGINEEHISLFLHLPILIGYNHPNNWRVIYK